MNSCALRNSSYQNNLLGHDCKIWFGLSSFVAKPRTRMEGAVGTAASVISYGTGWAVSRRGTFTNRHFPAHIPTCCAQTEY